MAHLNEVDFLSRFLARLASGLGADRPASPQGVGDAYYATDTHVISLANTAGTGWETFDLDGIGVVPDNSVRVFRTSTQSITQNSLTLVSWNSESYDTDGMHDNSTNPERLTVVNAGKYHVSVCIRWDELVIGHIQTQIVQTISGSPLIVARDTTYMPNTGSPPAQTFGVDLSILAGDYVTVQVEHHDSAAKNISNVSSHFSAHKIN